MSSQATDHEARPAADAHWTGDQRGAEPRGLSPGVLGQSEAPSPIVPPSMAAGSVPTPQWHAVSKPPAPIYNPRIDPVSGHIWVSALDSDAFSIFDTDGTLLETWGTAGKEDGQFHSGGGPDSLIVAFEPDGSFVVADTGNHRVQTFDKDRNHVATWGTFGPGEDQLRRP